VLKDVTNWPSVSGKVVSQWEEESESKSGTTYYSYYLEYEYATDSGTFRSQTYEMTSIGLGGSMPKEFYDDYFVGSKIQIWHHPHIHGISVLKNKVDRSGFAVTILHIFFSIPAIIGVVCLRSWCKDFKNHLKEKNPDPLKPFGTGFKGMVKRIVMAIISLIAIIHPVAPLYLGYFEMEGLFDEINSPIGFLGMAVAIQVCFWPIFVSEWFQAEVD